MNNLISHITGHVIINPCWDILAGLFSKTEQKNRPQELV